RIMLAETDAEVTVAPTGNRREVEAALARDPDVVIFEYARCDVDLARLAPRAELIDVSMAMNAGGCGSPTADPDTIIQAVRGSLPARSVGRQRPSRRQVVAG